MSLGEKVLPEKVGDVEPLARYIFSSNYFSKEKKRIKQGAFLPPPSRNEVSVMRHQGFGLDSLIGHGQSVGASRLRPQSLKAIASIMTARARLVEGVSVVSDTSKGQHERHANIHFAQYVTAKLRQKAKDLADQASLLTTI